MPSSSFSPLLLQLPFPTSGRQSTFQPFAAVAGPTFIITLLPLLFLLLLANNISPAMGQQQTEPAVRVVRFQVDYPDAEMDTVRKLPNWLAVMRKSVLASLRFVNKHWLICGEAKEPGEQQQQQRANSEKAADCGKLQVNGEQLGARLYRVNATFIANRDPVRNAKVETANSSVQSVLQIGLKGGIFQYTNAMKVLGKPNTEMAFEEAFFCYPNQEQIGADQCRPSSAAAVGTLAGDELALSAASSSTLEPTDERRQRRWAAMEGGGGGGNGPEGPPPQRQMRGGMSSRHNE